MQGLKHIARKFGYELPLFNRVFSQLTTHTSKLPYCCSPASSTTLPKSLVLVCMEMATSVITDEAELGSFADFLDNKISALFLSKEDFLITDTNIVHFAKLFLEANMHNKPAVTREAVEFYWWVAVRKVFKTGDVDQERLVRQASTFISLMDLPQVDSI